MAHVEEQGGGREVSVEPNIVPFIDLMSVLIIFLLITAVWTQVSMIQIGSSIYGKKTNDESVEVPPLANIPLRVDVLESGYRVVIGSTHRVFTLLESGEYDDKNLLDYLKEIKQRYPEKVDGVITIQDQLPYGALIRGMDSLLAAGFPQIAVSTVGVN